MTTTTFFWHDYETFGADPQRDRPCQFAGIRTDADFNIVGDPVMVYCKPTEDYLPHPEACLITGITPQLATEKGVCEAEFAAAIHAELARPGTCALGYNSLRFDDEVTRNLLYRNFYDAYGREWQNHNSRWDIIDVARAAHALRPDGVNWPLNAEGVAVFRLEELTKANAIGHMAAHDALSDVHATIAFARLIRERQPRLFNFLFEHRSKAAVHKLLQLGSYTPLVHVSGRYPARKNSMAIVLPICEHPARNSEVVVYDLSIDPAPLLELSAEEIRQRLFTAAADLPEGVDRIPLKTVHINRCPVLAPLSVITAKDAERLQLDMHQCAVHAGQIREQADNLGKKLSTVFTNEYAAASNDPDLMIYSGGFFGNRDKAAMLKIRTLPPEKLASLKPGFDDPRMPEMLFRYRARNYPNTLSGEELQEWRRFCRERLHDPGQVKSLTFATFNQRVKQLQAEMGGEQPILRSLLEYGEYLEKITGQ